ncbi:hypothetical protein D3C76_1669980 [compost metagenome]
MGVLQARLVDHLPWREVEHPLAVALQLGHGNAGDTGQLAHADRLVEMPTDMLVHRRQALVGGVAVGG